jgi:hypothetical protein
VFEKIQNKETNKSKDYYLNSPRDDMGSKMTFFAFLGFKLITFAIVISHA